MSFVLTTPHYDAFQSMSVRWSIDVLLFYINVTLK